MLAGIATCAVAMAYSPNLIPVHGASGVPVLNANVPAFRGQGQLAFVLAGRLFLLDGNRGAVRVLAGRAPTDPSWSADGRWLAYLADNPGASGSTLWIAKADGSGARALTALPAPVQSYRWSPDADILEVELITTNRTVATLWFVALTGGTTWGAHPVAGQAGPRSPDGTMLAYTVLRPSRDPLTRSEVLYTMPVRGGRPRPLLTYAGGIELVGWWPDSKGLVYRLDPQFSASLAADGLPLYTLRLGGTPRALPTTLGYREFMAFSPARRQVLVVAGGDRENWTNKSLRLCDIESATCRALLARRGTVTLDVDWAPHSNRIAFVRARNLGPVGGFSSAGALQSWVNSRTLWVAHADGSGAHEVTAAGHGIYLPQWSSDGRHVLFVRDNALWLIDVRGGAPVRVLGPFPGKPDLFGFYGHVLWTMQWGWNR